MKRQTKQLVALTAALAVFVGAYFALRAANSKPVADETAYLVSLGDIASISYENGGAPLSLTKTDGGWACVGSEDFPLDESRVDDLASALLSAAAVRVIVDPDPLADYGLAKPPYTVTAKSSDKQTVTLYLGNRDAGGAHRYALIDGDARVYTVDNALSEKLDYTLLELMELPKLPEMSSETLMEAVLTKSGKSDTLAKTETVYSEDGEDVTIYSWRLDGQELAPEADGLYRWYTALSDLKIEGCFAYKADAHTLFACGFDAPTALEIKLKENESAFLTFGAADEFGDRRYVTAGEPSEGCSVYYVTNAVAEALLDMSYETLTDVIESDAAEE